MKVKDKYQAKTFIVKHYRYMVLVFIVLFSLSNSLYRNMDRIHHKVIAGDNDGYWHLLRVQEIHKSGSWDNEINFRGNAPFGERIHWTHAMDIVLLVGAYLGSVFTDFDSSLYWFGVFVGPLFFILSLAALILFGRVILGKKHGVYLALLLAVNPLLTLNVYSVVRPDHHCLLHFLFIMYFFSFILLLSSPGGTVLAIFTGILGALGLWSGVELSILIGLSVLYLGILWVVDGNRYLEANFMLALALSVCIFATLLMDEKPDNFWVIAYDKRSIVHVTLFVFLALFWLAVILLRKLGVVKGVASRLIVAVGGAVVILFVYLSLFPDIVYGPLTRIDPKLHTLYLDNTSEFGTGIGMIVHSLLLIGPGLIYLLYSVRRVDQKKRVVFLWLILMICVYSVMTSMMNRWVLTLETISLLPNALLLIPISNWPNTAKYVVLTILIACGILVVPLLAPLVLNSTGRNESKDPQGYDFKVVDVLSFLESQDHTKDRETILANVNIGPSIMYHSSFNVVATPNHNNDKGIIDTYHIVSAEDDSTAKDLIEARDIDYILVDDNLKWFARIGTDLSGRSEDQPVNNMFIDRLTNGPIPDWLVRVPLPEELAETFWLYRVVVKKVKGG